MIRCICIDDSNKPNKIPNSHWVKKGNLYHINYVYKMIMQGNILGVTLSEINLLSLNNEFECFKLERFAIFKDDIEKLLQMFKDCNELNKLNIEELFNEQVLVKEEL